MKKFIAGFGIAGSVCQIKDFIDNRKEIAAEEE